MIYRHILSVLILASGMCGAIEIKGYVSNPDGIYRAIEVAKKEDPDLKEINLTVCVKEDDAQTWEGDLKKIVQSIGNIDINLSLELPDTVRSVGYGFLRGCSSLTSFVLPNTVTCVGSRFLVDCTGLTFFELPDTVICVGKCFLVNCTGLTLFEFSDTVTCVGNDFLYNCKNVQIYLPLVDSQRRDYFCCEDDAQDKSDEEKIALLQLGYESKLYMNGEEITPKELYENFCRVINLRVPSACALHLTIQKPPKRAVSVS
jgi:hypothetical protein